MEILASSSSTTYDGPRTPRYSFNPTGIDFGIKAIDKGAVTDVLIVDEVGQLELAGEGFASRLELIKADRVRNTVLVVRTELLSDFLLKLEVPTPIIFETTINNRNQLPSEIKAVLTEKLR